MNLLKHLPNMISTIRLFLAPTILLLLTNALERWALILFIIAGSSDLLDGYLARKYNLKTKLGSLLDPIADKLLILLCVTFFVSQGDAPWWWFGIILLREVSLLVGVLLLKSFSVQIEIFPTWIGKVATALNMFALVFLIASSFKPLLVSPLINPLIVLATLFTLTSFLQYTKKWFDLYRQKGS